MKHEFLINLILFGNNKIFKNHSYEFILYDLSSTQLPIYENGTLYTIELRDHEDKLTSISKCMFGGGVKKPHQHLLVLKLENMEPKGGLSKDPEEPSDNPDTKTPTDEPIKKKRKWSFGIKRSKPKTLKTVNLKAQVVPMDLITTQIHLSNAYEDRIKGIMAKQQEEIGRLDDYYTTEIKNLESRYKKQIDDMRQKMIELQQKVFNLEVDGDSKMLKKFARFQAAQKKADRNIDGLDPEDEEVDKESGH